MLYVLICYQTAVMQVNESLKIGGRVRWHLTIRALRQCTRTHLRFASRGVLLPAGPPKLEGLEGDAHLHGTRRRSEM